MTYFKAEPMDASFSLAFADEAGPAVVVKQEDDDDAETNQDITHNDGYFPASSEEDEYEPMIVDINMKGQNLIGFPSHILSHVSLHFLDLSRNNLRELPPEIDRLISLVHLDISENALVSLPKEIGNLHRLVNFNVSSNQLSDLPMEFRQLHALRDLRLGRNAFEDFPFALLELNKLSKLYIGTNQLQAFPDDIGDLTSLEILHCAGNKLRFLPATIGQLHYLSILNVGDNNLQELPTELCALRSLRTLNLHNNSLNYLPRDLVNLTTLQNLSLRGNPLVYDFINEVPTRPMSLLELAGRTIKNQNIPYDEEVLPEELVEYLDSARRCTGTNCDGVFFTHNVKSVNVMTDFCGKYRVPLMKYLCNQMCIEDRTAIKAQQQRRSRGVRKCDGAKMQKVLLSGFSDSEDGPPTPPAEVL